METRLMAREKRRWQHTTARSCAVSPPSNYPIRPSSSIHESTIIFACLYSSSYIPSTSPIACTKDLKVLCLGLGRTGTDSPRTALQQLRYSEVYHGWRVVDSETIGGSLQWIPLGHAKFRVHDEHFLDWMEFDRVIGDCEAVTDLPCAAFGMELLRAYSDAKVVLNRRRDVDAWYQSPRTTIHTLYRDWPSWTQQFFESEIFWIVRLMNAVVRPMNGNDFEENGMQMYEDHYTSLEAERTKQGRKWLNWTVEDGWDTLYRFLDQPVTDAPFPNENAATGFSAKRINVHHDRRARASRDMGYTALVVATGICAGTLVVPICGMKRGGVAFYD